MPCCANGKELTKHPSTKVPGMHICMSTSVPHQTAALHHIGQLQGVGAALKAAQDMMKHACMVGLWKPTPQVQQQVLNTIWIPGNKDAWVAALKAQLLDIGGFGEPSTEECSPSWEQAVEQHSGSQRAGLGMLEPLRGTWPFPCAASIHHLRYFFLNLML